MSKFDTIIFDLGGVVLDIDFNRADEAFYQLPAHTTERKRLAELFTFTAQDPFFTEFEVGNITAPEFRVGLCERLSLNVLDHDLDQAWNAILVDLPLERIELIKELRKDHQVLLFSNTNELHQNNFEEMFKHKLSGGSIHDLFDHVFYSHRIRDRKPNVSAYQHIITQAAITPSKAVFIDDSLPNIEGARAAGLHAYHLTGGESILERGWERNFTGR